MESTATEKTFKLHVLYTDISLFISELKECEIYYQYDEFQVNNSKRVLLLEKDRNLIDEIILDKRINTNVEGYPITEYRSDRKLLVLFTYLGIPIIIILVLFLVINFF